MKNNYRTPRITFLQAFFTLLCTLSITLCGFSQGANCAAADPITVNGACDTSNSNLSATNTPGPSCMEGFSREGWWEFTVSGGPMNITITAENAGTNRLSLSAYSGTCATLTEIGCENPNDGLDPTLTLNNLANGTYYIQGQYDSGNTRIPSICVSGTACTPPSTINTVTAITATSAIISWPAASPAPSNGYQWEVRTSGAGGSGATGLAATGTTADGVTTANVTGLTASTQYYIYVRSDCGGAYSTWYGTRTFTTTSIPGNIPCDAISVSNDGCTTQSNLGATGSIAVDGCMVGATNIQDIWLVTTADANGALEIETNHLAGSPMDDTVLAFYRGTCGSLTQITCDDDSGDGPLEAYEVLSGLAPNETIYIRIWGYNGFADGPGPFEICLNTSTASTPPNDLCTDAVPLACGDNNISGTTSGASNVNPGVSCSISTYGVWYTFTGNGDLYQVSVDPEAGYDIEMSISSGNCGSLSNIACVDSSGSGGLEYYEFVTTNGVDYYVYVADYAYGAGPFDVGDFTVSLSCQTVSPPPNDDPCNAVDLIVNGSCVSTGGTTQYATGTAGVPNPTCSNAQYSGGDVWYTVTVPPSFNSQMTISTQSGVVTDSGMAVYSGDCSGTLTLIACENVPGMTSISLTGSANGIVTGQVLYVRVWESGNNNNGTFSICATSPVTSGTHGVTICAGSPSEPLTTDLFCSTGTTQPNPLSGTITSSSPWAYSLSWWTESDDPCSFDTSLWRKYDTVNFTVTADGTYTFTIDDANTSLDDTLGYIYETDSGFTPGSCATGTYIAGDDVSGTGLLSEITATLSAGVNYTLVTTYGIGATTGTYEWDVDLNPSSAQWYDDETGGNLVGLGAFFDPVTAGALPDTDTPGTYSFWVACDATGTRTEAQFVISSAPSSITLSGTPLDCNNYEVTVTVDDVANLDGWYIEYTIDGANPTVIDDGTGGGVLTSSPYTFTISSTEAPAGSLIELSYAVSNDGPLYCETTNFIGSATTSYNCACVTWNGSVNPDWFNEDNWTPSGVPSSADCVVIPDTSSGSGNDPEIDGGSNADAGSLTVENGGILTVFGGGTLTVQDEVTVIPGGVFELQSTSGNPDGSSSSSSGSLIQVNNVSNSGSITFRRDAYVRTQDFVYWSSPVQNFAIGGISSTVHKYKWIPTVPANVPTEFGEWQQTSENMIPGKGYIVRGPVGNGNTAATATWNTVTFNGVPNNGTINLPIQRGTYTDGNEPNPTPGQADITKDDDNWNLVGNPYPSTLNANSFLTTNTNANKITGTLWLWTHVTRIGQGNQNNPFYGSYVYNYDEADYMSYNGTGSNPPGWNGNIGSGQGFFVLMTDDLSTSETLEFNNSMRVNNTEQFLRQSNPIERHRIWVDFINFESNQMSTVLVGYVEGATNEFDKLFDAPLMSGSTKKIFMPSETDETKFAIQGRALPFETSDVVPISVIIDQPGSYALAVQNYDGLFEAENQDIFIEDLEYGIIHNIKQSPYTFTADTSGLFENRFVLRFTNQALSNPEFNTQNISITAPESRYIKITSASQPIDQVLVYDLLGRVLITHKKVNAQELTLTKVPEASGTYLVKAVLQNGSKKVQKVIIK